MLYGVVYELQWWLFHRKSKVEVVQVLLLVFSFLHLNLVELREKVVVLASGHINIS